MDMREALYPKSFHCCLLWASSVYRAFPGCSTSGLCLNRLLGGLLVVTGEESWGNPKECAREAQRTPRKVGETQRGEQQRGGWLPFVRLLLIEITRVPQDMVKRVVRLQSDVLESSFLGCSWLGDLDCLQQGFSSFLMLRPFYSSSCGGDPDHQDTFIATSHL